MILRGRIEMARALDIMMEPLESNLTELYCTLKFKVDNSPNIRNAYY